MSSKEIAKGLIDQIPETKMFYVLTFLQGAAVPEEIPNADTLEAIEELKNGGGTRYPGSMSTKDVFAAVLAEEDEDD